MTNRKRRVEALEQRLQPTTTVPAFILAQNRADADKQLRQIVSEYPGADRTVFVMIWEA